MRNYWDWERVAEDIRRNVQNAVDSADFRRLNENIKDTINRTAGSFMGGSKPGDLPPFAFKPKKEPDLYAKMGAKKMSAMAAAVTGYTGAGLLALGCLVIFLAGTFLGRPAGLNLALSFLACLAVLFAVMGILGSRRLKKVKAFQTYVEELKGKEYCNIKELAAATMKKGKSVRKDLEWMIAKDWFLEGYLDDEKTCLMTSHRAYEEYRRVMKQREQQRREEEEEQKVQAARQQEQADKKKSLEPQVQEVIETGNAYIRKLRECNDAIPGEVISAKISRMELLTRRIFQRVEEDPGAVSDIRKMMEYYLPTAVKLLEAYENLDEQPVQTENITSSKREIEETIDTLNTAFEKLLDELFQETAWDVSSDISVLKTMLAQEGLTEDDFKAGGN